MFSKNKGCGKRLAQGQWWAFCGETDMGQTLPALCTDCGGEYLLATYSSQYTKIPAKNGCTGCIAERDAELCCDLPLCSPVNNNGVSVIFIESDSGHETKTDSE